VRVAYEATGAPYMSGQGINVVHWRSRFGWGHTCFFLAVPTDPYTAPSIEVTHYHDSSVAVAKDNYYSLSHERNGGSIIQNWAYDSTTSRYLPAGTMQYGATSPQVSVIRPSHDSLVLRMNMSTGGTGGSGPHWVEFGLQGLYKLGNADTLWGYRNITEYDSSLTLSISRGIGEIAVDDGSNIKYIDLEVRDDTLRIGKNCTAAQALSSRVFTLPKQGSLVYFRWIRPSNDSLYKAKFDTIKYALNFVDTSGTTIRLDSLNLCDSVSRIRGALVTIPLDLTKSYRGHLEFVRRTSVLRTDTAEWQDVISRKKLSLDSSYRRGSSVQASQLTFEAAPNPLHSKTELSFTIPEAGEVSVDLLDVLGRSVTTLAEQRMFHAGYHAISWNSTGLPSGMYLARLRYGNEMKILRLSVLK
jgi:hypothetical protein